MIKPVFTLKLIILFVVCSANLKGQNAADENSVLWEISGNGLQSPSYLFGTIHLIPEKEYLFSMNKKKN